VRCLRPTVDPTEVLAAGGMETQFLHDRRIAAMRELLRARAAAHGLSGLQSASVEVIPHQVEVVRRVLLDPVQRYLLADEVGMGKTIEAAIVLRQVLLDDAHARVLVLAPAPLVLQWVRELHEKFDIDENEERVTVAPIQELAGITPGEYDTLVVDEAHQV